jgi:hypothetical protein
MKQLVLNDLLKRFRHFDVPFPFTPGDHALVILERHLEQPMRIRDLRRGRFAHLLQQAAVKTMLGQGCGDGWLDRQRVKAWRFKRQTGPSFRLTVSSYGADRQKIQSARAGKTLVLQLNFPWMHRWMVRDAFGTHPNREYMLDVQEHPTRKDGMHTLAWARMDFLPEGNDILLEEIQSDRHKKWQTISYWREHVVREPETYGDSIWNTLDAIQRWPKMQAYARDWIDPWSKHWPEAMLSAVCWFSDAILGRRSLYMHTVASAEAWQFVEDMPVAPYTKTPKRLGFVPSTPPEWLMDPWVLNEAVWSPEAPPSEEAIASTKAHIKACRSLPMQRLDL